MNKVNCVWQDNMKFVSSIGKHSVVIDAGKEFGGSDSGPSPKSLILSSLAGCTAMDVVSMLKKMKVEFNYFNVNVSAELSEGHPKVYQDFKIVYEIDCDESDLPKINKAVTLSQDKYCGVSAMVRKFADINWEIKKTSV